MSEIAVVVACSICNKEYPVDNCTELIYEGESFEEDKYLCPYCLRELLNELRPHFKETIEKLKKNYQNPSER